MRRHRRKSLLSILSLVFFLTWSPILEATATKIHEDNDLQRGITELLQTAQQGWSARPYRPRDAMNCFKVISQLPMTRLGSVLKHSLEPALVASGCPASLVKVAKTRPQDERHQLFRIACEAGHAEACDQVVQGATSDAAYLTILRVRACFSGGTHCDTRMMRLNEQQLARACADNEELACIYQHFRSQARGPAEMRCQQGERKGCVELKSKRMQTAKRIIKLQLAGKSRHAEAETLIQKVREISSQEIVGHRHGCALYGGKHCTVLAGISVKDLASWQMACSLGSNDACQLLDAMMDSVSPSKK